MRPTFAEVAKRLGMPQAEPMLEFWSRFVGSWRKLNKDDDDDKRKMIKAASYLEDELAWYALVEKLIWVRSP